MVSFPWRMTLWQNRRNAVLWCLLLKQLLGCIEDLGFFDQVVVPTLLLCSWILGPVEVLRLTDACWNCMTCVLFSIWILVRLLGLTKRMCMKKAYHGSPGIYQKMELLVTRPGNGQDLLGLQLEKQRLMSLNYFQKVSVGCCLVVME